MEKKEIKAGAPVDVSGIRITPVIRTRAFLDCDKSVIVFGYREPVAVITSTPAGTLLFKITGEQITSQ